MNSCLCKMLIELANSQKLLLPIECKIFKHVKTNPVKVVWALRKEFDALKIIFHRKSGIVLNMVNYDPKKTNKSHSGKKANRCLNKLFLICIQTSVKVIN